jgi:hypothetical protein
MKIMLLLASLLLCSCSRDDAPGGAGGSAKPLSTDETRQVAMHILLNRYPEAQIVSQQEEGQTWKYRFATNGVTVPVTVVVDRKAGKAHFEKASQ